MRYILDKLIVSPPIFILDLYKMPINQIVFFEQSFLQEVPCLYNLFIYMYFIYIYIYMILYMYIFV